MAEQRIAWIDAARGIGIIGVVFYHVCLWDAGPIWFELGAGPAPYVWKDASSLMLLTSMPLLALVSGLVAGRTVSRGLRSPGLWRRVAAMYYLYVVWLAVTYALQLLTWKSRWPARIETPGSFLRQLLIPSTPLWYLLALGLWLAAFTALRQVPTAVLLPAVAAFSLYAAFAVPSGVEAKPLSHAIYFAVGLRGAPMFERWRRARFPVWPMASLAAGIGAWLVIQYSGHPASMRVATVLGGVVLAAGVAGMVAWASRLAVWTRPLAWMGTRSLEVYVASFPFTVLFANLAMRVGKPQALALVSTVPGAVIVPVVVAALVVALSIAFASLARAAHADFLFRMPPRWGSWIEERRGGRPRPPVKV